MKKWEPYQIAWTWAGTLVFVFFTALLVVLAHNDQERYLHKIEMCQSTPDPGTCVVLVTRGGG